MNKPNPTGDKLIEEVIAEFDQVFGVTLFQEYKPPIPYKNEQYSYVSCGEEIKNFIRQALVRVRQDTIEEIRIAFEGRTDLARTLQRMMLLYGDELANWILDNTDKITKMMKEDGLKGEK